MILEKIHTRCLCRSFIAALASLAIVLSGCSKESAMTEERKTYASDQKKEKKDKKEEEGVVTMSQEKQKTFGIKTENVIPGQVWPQISTTAVIELNTDRLAKISTRTSGKIVKVNVSQGDRVRKSQPLAYFDSPEIDLTWTEYLKSGSKRDLAQKNLKREETLFEQKVSPEKDVLKARQELSEAEADLMLAREKFRILGIDISEFENKKGNGQHPLIPVASPINGVVIEKNVSQGEVVGPDKVLFTVADLSNLWVVLDIFEKNIPLIRPGMSVKVAITAMPDKVFLGRISYIGDLVDENTRTVKARVAVDNSKGLLKPGMFATVIIDTAKGPAEKLIVIPEEAVIMEGRGRYVFVRIDPENFKKKEISLGRTMGNRVVVREGIEEGETVVVGGAFTLKSELKKGELTEE